MKLMFWQRILWRQNPPTEILFSPFSLAPGTCHYQNGNVYTGSWKAGLRCGNGTQQFKNGDRFEGGWKDGMMSGQVIAPRIPHTCRAL